jgi:hypothetical protein
LPDPEDEKNELKEKEKNKLTIECEFSNPNGRRTATVRLNTATRLGEIKNYTNISGGSNYLSPTDTLVSVTVSD